MEPTEETKKTSTSKTGVAIIVLLIVLIIAVFAAIFLMHSNANTKKNDNLTIGYASDASVMLDQDALQAAVDQAVENSKNSMVGLKFVNDAHSTDGLNFDCLIANSEGNLNDAYFQIFADSGMTDQIFMSGLVPPGSGFEHITLDYALDPGHTEVYVAVTLVETSESGAQSIVS